MAINLDQSRGRGGNAELKAHHLYEGEEDRDIYTWIEGEEGAVFEEGGKSKKIVEWVAAEQTIVAKMGNERTKKERESDVASKRFYAVLGKELHLQVQRGCAVTKTASITSKLNTEET